MIQPKYETQTQLGKLGNIAGNVAGFVTPFGLGKSLMTGAEKLGALGLSKIAPNLGKTVGGKIVGGVSKELAQTLGYAGAATLGSKLGLNQQENQFSPKNLATNLAMGSVLRGGIGSMGMKVKGFTLGKDTKQEILEAEDMLRNPKMYISKMPQQTFLTREKQITAQKAWEKEQIKKIKEQAVDIIGRISAKHLPNNVFTKLEGNPKAQIKALIDLSSQNK